MQMTDYTPGTFCWADLATTDAAAAKAFYTALFGWTATDVPTDGGPDYTMLAKDGKDVCALWELGAEQCQQGVAPHWQSYVSVTSADATAAKAQELGGKVVLEPMDVMDVGRMAVLQDPTGATLSVWQPRAHAGAQLIREVGTLCWNELQTHDPAAAERFYHELFGWQAHANDALMDRTYWEFRDGDIPAGGMLQIQPEWGEVPPNWSVYFHVLDCDAALERAKSLGGEVLVPPMDIETIGRLAFIKDPTGAVFAVIAFEAQQG